MTIPFLLLLCLAASPTLTTPGLHVIPLDGSPAVYLGPGLAPVWSADGQRLLVGSRRSVWSVDVATRRSAAPEPLRDYGPFSLPLAQGEFALSADGLSLERVDPDTRQATVVAELSVDGPVSFALSPDGRRLAVAVGETDRGGILPSDVVETEAVNVAGRKCKVTHRLRGVTPSGLGFVPAKLEFMGQAAPELDSPVATVVRAGGYRWRRPSPPRWVVLHHTATDSDGGSLNGLTTQSPGLLTRNYEDVTPFDKIKPEPSTLSVHYVVLKDGRVVQLVEERYLCRHAGAGQWGNKGAIFDFNPETIGIEIVSRGNHYTPAQVTSVGRLVADICRRHGLPLRRLDTPFAPGVLYHKDFAGGLRGKPDPSGWPWEAMVKAAGAG